MKLDASSAAGPWPHRCAVLLVCATFPLIWVGGLVTTYRAGMAVPDWPTTYGYNMFQYPLATWFFGPWDLFIEHGHRLLGALVGVLSIALLAAALCQEPRAWVRRMAWGAVALVIFQGGLGGARVLLDQRLLALIHGCVGPMFLIYATALAVVTSPRWRAAGPRELGDSMTRLAWLTLALAYLQLVVGAHLRHFPIQLPGEMFRVIVWFHVGLGLTVWAHVSWLAARLLSRGAGGAGRWAALLAGLATCQIGLGLAAWTAKYNWPSWLPRPGFAERYTVQAESMSQSLLVTSHVAVGSLILAVAVTVALRLSRGSPQRPSGSLKGAAS